MSPSPTVNGTEAAVFGTAGDEAGERHPLVVHVDADAKAMQDAVADDSVQPWEAEGVPDLR